MSVCDVFRGLLANHVFNNLTMSELKVDVNVVFPCERKTVIVAK